MFAIFFTFYVIAMIVVKSKGEIQKEASLENVKKTSGIEAYNKPILCDALSEENNEVLQEVDTVENWINRFVGRYDYGTQKWLAAALNCGWKSDNEKVYSEEKITIDSFKKRLVGIKTELIKYGADTESIDKIIGIVRNYIDEKSRWCLLSKLSEEQRERAQEQDIVYKLTSSFAVLEESDKALERWFEMGLWYDIFVDKISIEFLAYQLFRVKDRFIENGQDGEWVDKVMDKLVKYVLYGASNRTE